MSNKQHDVVHESQTEEEEAFEKGIIDDFHNAQEDDYERKIRLLAKLGKMQILKIEAMANGDKLRFARNQELSKIVDGAVWQLIKSWRQENLEHLFNKIMNRKRLHFAIAFGTGIIVAMITNPSNFTWLWNWFYP